MEKDLNVDVMLVNFSNFLLLNYIVERVEVKEKVNFLNGEGQVDVNKPSGSVLLNSCE